jgi:hypothetical protein
VDRCDAYRHFASNCVEQACRMDSLRDRSIMFEMALVWSRLAEYAAETAGKERTECQKSERASGEARGQTWTQKGMSLNSAW